jgi:hypothetical protein
MHIVKKVGLGSLRPALAAVGRQYATQTAKAADWRVAG